MMGVLKNTLLVHPENPGLGLPTGKQPGGPREPHPTAPGDSQKMRICSLPDQPLRESRARWPAPTRKAWCEQL